MNPSQEVVTLTFVKDIKKCEVSIYLHYSETVNIIQSAAQTQLRSKNLFDAIKTT